MSYGNGRRGVASGWEVFVVICAISLAWANGEARAEQLLRMEEPALENGASGTIQRKCATCEDDAKNVMAVLGPRFERFGLKLHPEKTRLFPFHPPNMAKEEGQKGQTFDFLGFTLYWRRTRAGRWMPALKTRKARLRRAIKAAEEWCRRHRHKSVKEQHATLKRKLVGHYNYFGVKGNIRSLDKLVERVKQCWRKWLDRRSQRGRMNWKRFQELERSLPLPIPRIPVQIWNAP